MCITKYCVPEMDIIDYVFVYGGTDYRGHLYTKTTCPKRPLFDCPLRILTVLECMPFRGKFHGILPVMHISYPILHNSIHWNLFIKDTLGMGNLFTVERLSSLQR